MDCSVRIDTTEAVERSAIWRGVSESGGGFAERCSPAAASAAEAVDAPWA
jgi:hypothetical protein